MRRDPRIVAKELRSMTDGLGMPLDKGIFRSCVILNSLGYKTRQSCAGHVRRYETYPWIDLVMSVDEIKENIKNEEKIEKLVQEFGKTLYLDLQEFYQDRKVNHDSVLSLVRFRVEDGLEYRLEQLTSLKIFGRQRSQKMKCFFKEIQDFCEFLNQKYELNY